MISRYVLLAGLILTLMGLSCGQALADKAPKSTSVGKQYSGIVRIENAANYPDYRTPWNGARPSGGSGTGFFIGNNKFLTNAHVVSNTTRLLIKRVDDARPRLAKIEHIAHDCDLAMFSLVDPRGFDEVEPLKLADGLPLLDSDVNVVGYPVGGDRISVTRGVVSRIDFQNYSHSGVDQHLTIQVDAAINPGNSGGPVLQDGKVVGIAFQGYSGAVAQNTGYIIPVPVIERFLKDITDGKYDYYADMAIMEFSTENPAMRKALGLKEEDGGVLIIYVDASGSCAGLVKKGDVLLAIDGKKVESDGFIEFDSDRVNMNEIVERKFVGDTVKLKLWRENKELEVTVALRRLTSYLYMANGYERRPEYVVFSGLVFQPLDRDLMNAFNFRNLEVRYFYNYYAQKELYRERPEGVILTQVLDDAINTHLKYYTGGLVDEINGLRIRKLRDVPDALNQGTGDFHVIKLAGEHRPLVLDRKLAAEADGRINLEYGVKESSYIDESPEKESKTPKAMTAAE